MSKEDRSPPDAIPATRIRLPCPRCRDPMRNVRTIPAVASAPELRIYVCDRCGNVVTNEVSILQCAG